MRYNPALDESKKLLVAWNIKEIKNITRPSTTVTIIPENADIFPKNKLNWYFKNLEVYV